MIDKFDLGERHFLIMNMIRFAVLILAIALAACQSIPSKVWVASQHTDEFTDETTKMVTVGSFSWSGRTYTEVGKYYPFISMKNGQLYVGIRSGGNIRIPTGTVQIRVDDNPAWTITPDETPSELIPGTAGPNANLQADMMANMAKILSPYTAAVGEKAREIIKQMAVGSIVRYRTVGLNQAASTTGEVKIDNSFFEALNAIGVDPHAL